MVQRELVQRLAAGDATHSTLVNSMPRRYPETLLQRVPEILRHVADYRTPSGVDQGRYGVNCEFDCEVKLIGDLQQ